MLLNTQGRWGKMGGVNLCFT